MRWSADLPHERCGGLVYVFDIKYSAKSVCGSWAIDLAWGGGFMVVKYMDLLLCFSFVVSGEALNSGEKEMVCEVYAADDVEYRNCLDKFSFGTGTMSFDEAFAVVLPFALEYVRKKYTELVNLDSPSLGEVLDNASKRVVGGWVFNEDTWDDFEDAFRETLYGDLGGSL